MRKDRVIVKNKNGTATEIVLLADAEPLSAICYVPKYEEEKMEDLNYAIFYKNTNGKWEQLSTHMGMVAAIEIRDSKDYYPEREKIIYRLVE